jgi:hypothetical protein
MVLSLKYASRFLLSDATAPTLSPAAPSVIAVKRVIIVTHFPSHRSTLLTIPANLRFLDSDTRAYGEQRVVRVLMIFMRTAMLSVLPLVSNKSTFCMNITDNMLHIAPCMFQRDK